MFHQLKLNRHSIVLGVGWWRWKITRAATRITITTPIKMTLSRPTKTTRITRCSLPRVPQLRYSLPIGYIVFGIIPIYFFLPSKTLTYWDFVLMILRWFYVVCVCLFVYGVFVYVCNFFSFHVLVCDDCYHVKVHYLGFCIYMGLLKVEAFRTVLNFVAQLYCVTWMNLWTLLNSFVGVKFVVGIWRDSLWLASQSQRLREVMWFYYYYY